jgi:long-chain acyl-CoA synthetase
MLLRDIFVSNAHRYPNKLALVDGDCKMTWRELNERVNRVSNMFPSIGMSKGDRIAMLAENCHQYAEILFASVKSG